MDPDPPAYSIIVPAYNEEANLPETLPPLLRALEQQEFAGELIVVDNNSTDGTRQVAEGLGARVVFEGYNQISRARNAGAAAARGKWLIFVDADTVIQEHLIRDALAQLASGGCVAGGAEVAFWGTIPASARFVNATWNLMSRTLGLAAGCFVFCTREAFEAVGGFSEEVYASEEVWLSRNLKRWGRKRGQKFCILPRGGLATSPRKLHWHSQWKVAATVILFSVFPFAVRNRRFCNFWYRRP